MFVTAAQNGNSFVLFNSCSRSFISRSQSLQIDIPIQSPFLGDWGNIESTPTPYDEQALEDEIDPYMQWWPYPSRNQPSEQWDFQGEIAQERIARRHSAVTWSSLYEHSEAKAESLLLTRGGINERIERSSSEGNNGVHQLFQDQQNDNQWTCSIREEGDESKPTLAPGGEVKVNIKRSESHLTLVGREDFKKVPLRKNTSRKRLASLPQRNGSRQSLLLPRSQSTDFKPLPKFDEKKFGQKIRPLSQSSMCSTLSVGLRRNSDNSISSSVSFRSDKTLADGCVEVEEGEYDRRDSVWEDVN